MFNIQVDLNNISWEKSEKNRVCPEQMSLKTESWFGAYGLKLIIGCQIESEFKKLPLKIAWMESKLINLFKPEI